MRMLYLCPLRYPSVHSILASKNKYSSVVMTGIHYARARTNTRESSFIITIDSRDIIEINTLESGVYIVRFSSERERVGCDG